METRPALFLPGPDPIIPRLGKSAICMLAVYGDREQLDCPEDFFSPATSISSGGIRTMIIARVNRQDHLLREEQCGSLDPARWFRPGLWHLPLTPSQLPAILMCRSTCLRSATSSTSSTSVAAGRTKTDKQPEPQPMTPSARSARISRSE